MQFQSYYNRFLLSLEGTKNIYVSFCENIISFCAPRTFRFADYNRVLPWFHPMSYHHKCTHYHIYICDYIFELQFFVAIAHKLQHIQNLPF